MDNQELQQIQNLVNSAARVLILTHKNPSIDAMGSALAIYLALSKMGKDVTIAMESEPLVEVSNLVGIDRVKTSLTGKNLQITYQPYAVGDFEKVVYMDDPGTQPGALADSFKLTITPRDGFVPDPKNFNFTFTGASADLIFTVDIQEPTQLGSIYDASLFAGQTPIINIDNHDANKDYGRFNLVEPEAASVSEIVTFFLRAVNAQLDADIANNLYQGIVQATRNFQSDRVVPASFEAAAIALRNGAKPKLPVQPVVQGGGIPFQGGRPNQGQAQGQNQSQNQPQRQGQNFPPRQNPQQNPQRGQNQVQNINRSPVQRQGVQPQPIQPQPVQTPPQPDNQPQEQPQEQTGQNQPIPEEWTQPKAFRGTSVV